VQKKKWLLYTLGWIALVACMISHDRSSAAALQEQAQYWTSMH